MKNVATVVKVLRSLWKNKKQALEKNQGSVFMNLFEGFYLVCVFGRLDCSLHK